jgi:hypothetical protein
LPKALLKARHLRQPVPDRFEVGVIAQEAGKGSGGHLGE